MWRRARLGTSSSVFASLPRGSSGRREALAVRWQWRDFNASKALLGTEAPSDKQQHAVCGDAGQPQSNQGAEAMKITRLGMYVNLGMAVTKVRRCMTVSSPGRVDGLIALLATGRAGCGNPLERAGCGRRPLAVRLAVRRRHALECPHRASAAGPAASVW